MNIKYIVTTRTEILNTLRQEGFYIIGVDGTVPKSTGLYDELYDHHRPGGEPIQILELYNFVPPQAHKVAIVTTMLDADAICSAYYITKKLLGIEPDNLEWLEAISFDCDHLGVPEQYSDLADDAAMAVAALKENSNNIVAEMGLNPDRRSWSIEEKEAYASKGFETGVLTLDDPHWDYRTIAEPYWVKVEEHTQMIIDQERIEITEVGYTFNAIGIKGYIDPRCWIKGIQLMGLESPERFITLAMREVYVDNQLKGISYTLGTVPLHPKQKDWDFTQGVFEALTQAERAKNPEADGWGGRKTIGGSGWNTPSLLTPQEIFDTLKEQTK